jgi:hypothetical protein
VVDENGTAVPGGSGTAALALVNNVIYGEDATSKSWYTYSTTAQSWTASAAPVLTSTPTPTPAPTPTPTPSPTPTPTPTSAPTVAPTSNQITTASGGTLTDAAGNKWTLTSAGVVEENGTAVAGGSGSSAVVLASNVVYGQDATSKSWYSYANGNWTAAAAPTVTASVSIPSSLASATVSASQVSVNVAAGTHILFITGSSDTVNLAAGTNTITDTGKTNTYVLPAAGGGSDTFTSNVLTAGDTLDLRTALAATNWTGSASTLSNYLSVTSTSKAAVLSIAATSGGKATAIATIDGASGTSLTSLLTHAIT